MRLFTKLRSVVSVEMGAKVHYDPPRGSDDYASQQFFDKYRGKFATVIGFGQECVGPLDFLGRKPGTYHNPDGLKVRFGDGTEENLNIQHFVLIGPGHIPENAHALYENDMMRARIGDLSEPIEFYPDDLVLVKGKKATRPVLGLTFNKDTGAITYLLGHTERERRGIKNSAQQEKGILVRMQIERRTEFPARRESAGCLELVRGGNIRALYEGRAPFFAGFEDELKFWTRSGLSRPIDSLLPHGEKALEILEKKGADFLQCRHTDAERQRMPVGAVQQCCSAYRLLECWRVWRTRVQDMHKATYKPIIPTAA